MWCFNKEIYMIGTVNRRSVAGTSLCTAYRVFKMKQRISKFYKPHKKPINDLETVPQCHRPCFPCNNWFTFLLEALWNGYCKRTYNVSSFFCIFSIFYQHISILYLILNKWRRRDAVFQLPQGSVMVWNFCANVKGNNRWNLQPLCYPLLSFSTTCRKSEADVVKGSTQILQILFYLNTG